MTILDCCLQGQGRSEGSYRPGIFVRTILFLLNDLTCLHETWYGVAHHRDSGCHTQRMVSYHQGQGHSVG